MRLLLAAGKGSGPHGCALMWDTGGRVRAHPVCVQAVGVPHLTAVDEGRKWAFRTQHGPKRASRRPPFLERNLMSS